MNVLQYFCFIYKTKSHQFGVFSSFSSACCGVKLSEIQNDADKHLDVEGDNCPELFQSILLPFHH